MSKELLIARRLRPYLFCGFKRSQCLVPARHLSSTSAKHGSWTKMRANTHDYEQRVEHLQTEIPLHQCHPRLPQSIARNRIESAEELNQACSSLEPDETDTDQAVAIAGRIKHLRTIGSKLLFIDLEAGESTFQAHVAFNKIQQSDESVDLERFKSYTELFRRGDILSVVGHPHRTTSGQRSVLSTETPTLLSPCLRQIPRTLDDAETRTTSRHLDMLVNSETLHPLHVRHEVERSLQDFLNERHFTKVTTPILGSSAGGALARAFETEATELVGQRLNLRIAPELWLKRLVVGGLDRVYEIGPAFRNEGVDATHNPEFQICEFYQAYATLPDLMQMTKELMAHLKSSIQDLLDKKQLQNFPPLDPRLDKHFEEVEFIPRLEKELDCRFPDLESAQATQDVLNIFNTHQIPTPAVPTLSRLLDTLCERYLEPISHHNPVFITHHPACMSPLSKHFTCPQTHQTVAARAELFIAGREYANMYEEENSPFEQRRKFEEQLRQRDRDAEAMEVDEQYLETLGWGLPPTGGWGCGLDRMVMLFSGRDRMSDVLAFGSLRNVVALGKQGMSKGKERRESSGGGGGGGGNGGEGRGSSDGENS